MKPLGIDPSTVTFDSRSNAQSRMKRNVGESDRKAGGKKAEMINIMGNLENESETNRNKNKKNLELTEANMREFD